MSDDAHRPIPCPVIKALGFNPIWYGVIMVMVLETWLITPPVGLNVLAMVGVSGGVSGGMPMNTIFKGIWPFPDTGVVGINLGDPVPGDGRLYSVAGAINRR